MHCNKKTEKIKARYMLPTESRWQTLFTEEKSKLLGEVHNKRGQWDVVVKKDINLTECVSLGRAKWRKKIYVANPNCLRHKALIGLIQFGLRNKRGVLIVCIYKQFIWHLIILILQFTQQLIDLRQQVYPCIIKYPMLLCPQYVCIMLHRFEIQRSPYLYFS